MNKKVLLFLTAIGLSVSIIAQQFFLDSIPVDENGLVRYESIFEATGTRDQLFTKAKIWLADAFSDSKSVIQTEDKAEGTIIGKGNLRYNYDYYLLKKKKIVKDEQQASDKIDFTIKFFLKDNKAKIVITDIILLYPSLSFMNEVYDRKIVSVTKTGLGSDNQETIRKSMTNASKMENIHNTIIAITESVTATLSKKAENDF